MKRPAQYIANSCSKYNEVTFCMKFMRRLKMNQCHTVRAGDLQWSWWMALVNLGGYHFLLTILHETRSKEISCLHTNTILLYLHETRKWVSLFGATEFLGVMLPEHLISILRAASLIRALTNFENSSSVSWRSESPYAYTVSSYIRL
jgi:hypothetical protein